MSKKQKSWVNLRKESLSVTRKRKSMVLRSDRQGVKMELLSISKAYNYVRR